MQPSEFVMRILVLLTVLLCAACASAPGSTTRDVHHSLVAGLNPRIETPSKPLQCVPYARKQSGIGIYGDAWTWWGKADRSFAKGGEPRVGAVMVFKGKQSQRGHLAVVTKVVGDRHIVIKHANWLNRGRIHVDTPVLDVSGRNDWSAVRVWYVPGQQLGTSTYGVQGFIYPNAHIAMR